MWNYNRHNNGKYAKKTLNWTKIANDAFMLLVILWISFTFFYAYFQARS